MMKFIQIHIDNDSNLLNIDLGFREMWDVYLRRIHLSCIEMVLPFVRFDAFRWNMLRCEYISILSKFISCEFMVFFSYFFSVAFYCIIFPYCLWLAFAFSLFGVSLNMYSVCCCVCGCASKLMIKWQKRYICIVYCAKVEDKESSMCSMKQTTGCTVYTLCTVLSVLVALLYIHIHRYLLNLKIKNANWRWWLIWCDTVAESVVAFSDKLKWSFVSGHTTDRTTLTASEFHKHKHYQTTT